MARGEGKKMVLGDKIRTEAGRRKGKGKRNRGRDFFLINVTFHDSCRFLNENQKLLEEIGENA